MVITLKFAAILLLVACVCVGCGADAQQLGIARRISESCAEQDSQRRFFRDVFPTTGNPSEGDPRGVADLLVKLGESSMSCTVDYEEGYRLTYIPQRGSVLAIRASKTENHFDVTVSGGDSERRSQSIDSEAWKKLTDAMSGYNFWSRSPLPSPSSIHHEVIVTHGQAWVLEGRVGKWYHAVSRLSSSKEPEFDVPARTLFEIAKLEIPGIVKPRP
jgi:hypothetical protein